MIKVFNSFVGAEISVNSFSLFTSICKYLAEKMHTLEEHREYQEHGFGSVWFMTDKFGGNYAGFHFNLKTSEVTYMKGHPKEERITSLERMTALIEADRKRMMQARDLRAISERVNAEY